MVGDHITFALPSLSSPPDGSAAADVDAIAAARGLAGDACAARRGRVLHVPTWYDAVA